MIFKDGLEINSRRTKSARYSDWIALAILLLLLCLAFVAFVYPKGRFEESEIAQESMDSFWEHETSHTVRFTDQDGNEVACYTVKHGDPIGECPEYPYKEHELTEWDFPNYSNLPVSEIPVYEDMCIMSNLTDLRLILLNGLTVAGMELKDVDEESVSAFIEQIKEELLYDEEN